MWVGEDVYVGNSLLAMYLKFGDVGMAWEVFDRMPKRALTSWNIMILGCANNGSPEEALVFFRTMRKDGVTIDCTTLPGILSACTDLGALKQGKVIYSYVISNKFVHSNDYLINSLIELYCCCNSMLDARRFFDLVTRKDTVSWNSMISSYARNGDAFEGMKLFCQMGWEDVSLDRVTIVAVLGACFQITALQQFGLSVHYFIIKGGFGSNAMVGTALMDMYSKCGSLACSSLVFEEIPTKNWFLGVP